ncbi:choline kinase family protein [Microbulbifer elongatus]|uniref:choline kinase family protein n=1 Tax=Microbulbifer elongatus TaxID=86173 RepID=UPI001E38C426|nr:choline kinase family protein [Microbulbifer elongatus]
MKNLVDTLLAEEWQHWSDQPPRYIRPLGGGLTNHSFLIQTGSDRLVLRINAANSSALDLNRSAEVEALTHASKANLSAPLVYSDPGHRYLITRFIDATPLTLTRPNAIADLSRLLRQLHRLPQTGTHLDYAAKAETYWQSIQPSDPLRASLKQLREKIQPRLIHCSQQTDNHCLCHNDLLPGNLLVDNTGVLRAIDWEYAACGHRFFDLATVTLGFEMKNDQQQTLLEGYLQRPVKDGDLEKLQRWQQVYRYLSILWYGVQRNGKASPPLSTAALQSEIRALTAELV